MTKCKSCGSSQEPDSNFCDECGNPLPGKAATVTKEPRAKQSEISPVENERDWEGGSSKRLVVSFVLAVGVILGLAFMSMLFEGDAIAEWRREGFVVPVVAILVLVLLAIWPAKRIAPRWSLPARLACVAVVAISAFGIWVLVDFVRNGPP